MKKKDLRIIKAINAEAWEKYGKKLFRDVEKAPAVKEVIEKALTEKRELFTEAQLDKLQTIKDSGMLEGTKREEDPKVAEQFGKYIEKRIKQEVKAGNLTDPELSLKKAKQNARRNTKDNA